LTAWKRRPPARSREKYPATADEQRAAEFVVSCRRVGVTISFEEIESLCNQQFPGLGRGKGGRWERHLIARIVARAAKTDPTITPKRRSPTRTAPKAEAPRTPAAPSRLALFARFMRAVSDD
jgi:hypothetical protein